MKVNVILPGRIRPRALEPSEKIYTDRLKKEKIHINIYRPNKYHSKITSRNIIKNDSLLLQQFKKDDYVVICDEKGVQVKTNDVTNLLKLARSNSDKLYNHRRLVFSIGDSYGFSDEILNRADEIWSLSGLVMAGGIARLVLLEALYRSVKILEGHPYHNE